jgi:hypothetical protein
MCGMKGLGKLTGSRQAVMFIHSGGSPVTEFESSLCHVVIFSRCQVLGLSAWCIGNRPACGKVLDAGVDEHRKALVAIRKTFFMLPELPNPLGDLGALGAPLLVVGALPESSRASAGSHYKVTCNPSKCSRTHRNIYTLFSLHICRHL